MAAWQGAGASGVQGIYQREFNADGTPRIGERRVNTTDSGKHESPTVQAQAPYGYVIVWDGQVGDDSQGIGLQRYGDPSMPTITSRNKLIRDPKHPDDTTLFPEVIYLDESVPMKTITLTNTSNLTVYPILEDANGDCPGGQ